MAAPSVLTRLGQIVYTLTQFPSVKSVVFQIEGDQSVQQRGRRPEAATGDFVELLPAIWVDRPAFNAAIGNPAHVTGNANVFEATFRISILDGSGKVLADQQVMATCGTGCRGTFDTTIAYTVAKAQYGTLRVYEPSAKDGTPESSPRLPGLADAEGLTVRRRLRHRTPRPPAGASSCPPRASGVLDRDPLDDVRDVLGLVDRRLEESVDVLPLDEVDRVLLVDEQPGDRGPDDPVALVLEAVDLDPVRDPGP